MKRAWIMASLVGLGACLMAGPQIIAQDEAKKPEEFKTTKEKVSYGFGRDIGSNISRNLKSQGIDVDPAALVKGIEDSLTGGKSRVSDEDLQAALKIFQEEMIAKAKKRRDDQAKERLKSDPVFKAQAEKNAKEGEEFLKKNKAKKGVTTTESGLQYEILKAGTGKKPAKTDIVKTHYHGTLPNGEVFDSSVESKMPATFSVEGVIDGWTEALQLMPVGSKWRLVVPPQLAYGLSGSGRSIGPNQVLVFEVELLSIETPGADQAAPKDE